MDVQRRSVLRLLGVAGLGTLAGCGGSGSGAGTDTSAVDRSSTATSGEGTASDTETAGPTTTPREYRQAVGSALVPSDGDERDRFGTSVAVSGDGVTAIVGAPNDEDPNGKQAGSAYVFTQGSTRWREEAKLTAPDGDPGDAFGASVAVSADGSTAVVGAYGVDSNGDTSGVAHVFVSDDGWQHRTRLSPSDGDGGDFFGTSLALSGDGTTAIVGAPGDEDPNGKRAGSAYVFSETDGGWEETAKIVAPDGDSEDVFGGSVALSADGETAVVGAQFDEDPTGRKGGSVYVFDGSRDGWQRDAKLAPETGDTEELFGRSVALSSDGATVLVGGPRNTSPTGASAGAAYVFTGGDGTWTQETKLTAPDGDSSDVFGRSVALSADGGTALVSAPFDEDPNGKQAGSAYVFARTDAGWQSPAKLYASSGRRADVFGNTVTLSDDASVGVLGTPNGDSVKGGNAGVAYVSYPSDI